MLIFKIQMWLKTFPRFQILYLLQIQMTKDENFSPLGNEITPLNKDLIHHISCALSMGILSQQVLPNSFHMLGIPMIPKQETRNKQSNNNDNNKNLPARTGSILPSRRLGRCWKYLLLHNVSDLLCTPQSLMASPVSWGFHDLLTRTITVEHRGAWFKVQEEGFWVWGGIVPFLMWRFW